jgi:hypothetical protein
MAVIVKEGTFKNVTATGILKDLKGSVVTVEDDKTGLRTLDLADALTGLFNKKVSIKISNTEVED